MEALRRIVQRVRRFAKKDYHELERRQNELNYDELERRQRKAGLRQFLASRSHLRPGKLLQPQRQAVIQRSVNNSDDPTIFPAIVDFDNFYSNLTGKEKLKSKVNNIDANCKVNLNNMYLELSEFK